MTLGLARRLRTFWAWGLLAIEDLAAVPAEPDRDEVRAAVGPNAAQPDDGLLAEEPIDPGGRGHELVHARIVAAHRRPPVDRCPESGWTFVASGRVRVAVSPQRPPPRIPPRPPPRIPPSRSPISGWLSAVPPGGTCPVRRQLVDDHRQEGRQERQQRLDRQAGLRRQLTHRVGPERRSELLRLDGLVACPSRSTSRRRRPGPRPGATMRGRRRRPSRRRPPGRR